MSITALPASDTPEFKIEPAIAIPPAINRGKRFPFHQMKIGDSFFVLEATVKSTKLRNAAADFTKRNAGWHFVTRKMKDSADRPGCRVWRVAAEIASQEPSPPSKDDFSTSNPNNRPLAQ